MRAPETVQWQAPSQAFPLCSYPGQEEEERLDFTFPLPWEAPTPPWEGGRGRRGAHDLTTGGTCLFAFHYHLGGRHSLHTHLTLPSLHGQGFLPFAVAWTCSSPPWDWRGTYTFSPFPS